MPPNSKPSPPSPLRVVVIVLIALLIVIFLVWRGLHKPIAPPPPIGETFRVNLEDPALEIHSLIGWVTAVRSDAIEIDVPSILGTPISQSSPLRHRIVRVSATTRIYREIQKSREKYDAERAAYQAALLRGERATPPSPKNESSLTLREIKVGASVNVVGERFADIKNALDFAASEISIES